MVWLVQRCGQNNYSNRKLKLHYLWVQWNRPRPMKSSASINFYRSKGNFFFLEDINYEFSFLPLFSLALIAQTVSVRTKVQLLISWLLSWKSRYTLSCLYKISSVFEITYRLGNTYMRKCATVHGIWTITFDATCFWWKQSVNLKLPDHSKETLWLFL